MLDGFTANTPNDLIITSGLLYLGNVAQGVLAAPLEFDPGIQMRNSTFAGKTTDVANLDRVIRYESILTARFKEWTAARIAALMPGSAVTTPSAGVTRIVPPDAHVMLPSIDNVRGVWKTAAGKFYEIRLIKGFPVRGAIAAGDPDEAAYPASFAGRVSLAGGASIDDPPFEEYISDALLVLP